MDRKLIAGALALLFIQVFLLVSDVDIYPGAPSTGVAGDAKSRIGVILDKKQSVKRRSLGSVVWEDTEKSDTLLGYDSLLTLENSSAQLKLENDVRIDLHENTLVVLEPPEKEQEDSLRIRFARGDLLSRNRSGRGLLVGSGEWRIEAKPGTDMSLKSLDGEKVEVQVSSGAVEVRSTVDAAKTETVTPGQRFTLSENTISAPQTVDEELRLELRAEERVYAHKFPIEFVVRWKGEATRLRVVEPGQPPRFVSLENQDHHLELSLQPGSYYLSLENGTKISAETAVRALPAPMIRYTSPLPRDRFTWGDSVLFSWTPLEGAVRYEVMMTDADGHRLVQEAGATREKLKPDLENSVQWRVFGLDELGFRIPPQYAQEMFMLRDPLAPPRLVTPETLAAPGAFAAPGARPAREESSAVEPRAPASSSPSREGVSAPGGAAAPRVKERQDIKPGPEESSTDKSAHPDGANATEPSMWQQIAQWLVPVAAAEDVAAADALAKRASDVKAAKRVDEAAADAAAKPASRAAPVPGDATPAKPASDGPPAPRVLIPKQVLFSWYDVPGADFYTIEISTTPDFASPEVIAKALDNSFAWTNFSKQIYYWRVAAGSNSGRMGLFSETAALDLTRIQDLASGEISPGVKLVDSRKTVRRHEGAYVVSKPLRKVEVTGSAAVTPKGATATPTTTAAKKLSPTEPSSAEKISNEKSASAESLPSSAASSWSFLAELNLQALNYSYDQNFSATLNGIANAAVSFGADSQRRDGSVWRARGSYATVDWEAKSEATWPYQPKLRSQLYAVKTLYFSSSTAFGYGLQLETIPVLKRSGLESLAVETELLVGPVGGYDFLIKKNLALESSVALMGGGGLYSVDAQATMRATQIWRHHAYYVGGGLAYNIFFGPDSVSGTLLRANVHIGIEF